MKRGNVAEQSENGNGRTKGDDEVDAMPRKSGPAPRAGTEPERATGTRRRDEVRTQIAAWSQPPPPDLTACLNAATGFDGALQGQMHREEIVHVFLERAQTLLPGRRFVIRLFDPRDGTMLLVHATGRLHREKREHRRLSRAAADRYGVGDDVLAASEVDVVPTYMPEFEAAAQGFDVPLIDGDRLSGIVGVEYAADASVPDDDLVAAGILALQLAASLRGARIKRESGALRGYLAELLDHSNVPIVVIGRQREIRVASRAMLALTGLEREDVIGRDLLTLVPEEERGRLTPLFVSALRGRSISSYDISVVRASGGHAKLSIDASSVLGPDGEIEGVIAVGRDVTALRDLERQVVHAERLATLGKLAAGIVHELNNPLTSITVYAEYLMKKAPADGTDAQKLQRIVEAAERILRFTRDLVTYARPSAEPATLVSVQEIVEQSLTFCEHLLDERGIEVTRSFDRSLPGVRGVRSQLHQIFINLVTNACQSMDGRPGKLTLEASVASPMQVCIRVADNGTGIPNTHFETIFEPFFSTKPEGQGTGLGLSIVRNLVEQHGGRIEVASKIGQGTIFSIYLPMG